jgi:hypothetical protein
MTRVRQVGGKVEGQKVGKVRTLRPALLLPQFL